MEHTKKMYLVPREILRLIEEKRTQPVAPLTRTLGALDQQLEDTLTRSDLPPDEQVKLFDQQAQRWQTYQEKHAQPLPVTLNVVPQDKPKATDSTTPPKTEANLSTTLPKTEVSLSKDSIEEDVMESIPKSMKVKAKWLLQRIKRSGTMDWNGKGELVVQGSTIPGTHLVDLINDVVRNRKRASNVIGWQEFANGLRQLHIPQEVVGNAERWNYIRLTEEPDDPMLQASNSKVTRKLRRTKRKRKSRASQETDFQWDPY